MSDNIRKGRIEKNWFFECPINRTPIHSFQRFFEIFDKITEAPDELRGKFLHYYYICEEEEKDEKEEENKKK